MAEPIEEGVKVVGSLHTSPLWAGPGFGSSDGSNTSPDVPHVIFLQLLLHFLAVAVVSPILSLEAQEQTGEILSSTKYLLVVTCKVYGSAGLGVTELP